MKTVYALIIGMLLSGCGDGSKGSDGAPGKDGVVAILSVFCEGELGTSGLLLHYEHTDFNNGEQFIKCFASFPDGELLTNANYRTANSKFKNQCILPIDGIDVDNKIQFKIDRTGDILSVQTTIKEDTFYASKILYCISE